jgi:hypothetical protein
MRELLVVVIGVAPLFHDLIIGQANDRVIAA